TGCDPPRLAVGGGDRELGDDSYRGDAPDLVPARFGKPEVAIRAGGDRQHVPIVVCGGRELVKGTGNSGVFERLQMQADPVGRLANGAGYGAGEQLADPGTRQHENLLQQKGTGSKTVRPAADGVERQWSHTGSVLIALALAAPGRHNEKSVRVR